MLHKLGGVLDGLAATRRNRSCPTRPTRFPLASPATARKKPKTIRFQPTFPEIGSRVQFLWHTGGRL